MNLLLVELTRLRARRAIALLLAACVVIPGLVFASTAWNTRPVSASERAAVTELIEAERQNPQLQKQYRKCLANPERWGAQGPDLEASCDEMTLPQPEWYSSRSELDLSTETGSSGTGVAVILAVLLTLIGTTFVGHDWNTRSMSNQLLFEPRRGRVWAAKAGAVLVISVVACAVVLTAFWGGLWMLAESRGIDTSPGTLAEVRGQAGRALLLASFGAVGGYALTMLLRSTVGTLGVLFAASIVVPLLLALTGFDGYPRYLPHNNVAAVLADGITYYDETAFDECTGFEDDCGFKSLTAGEAGRYFGAVLVLVAVPSALLFRRRDVP